MHSQGNALSLHLASGLVESGVVLGLLHFGVDLAVFGQSLHLWDIGCEGQIVYVAVAYADGQAAVVSQGPVSVSALGQLGAGQVVAKGLHATVEVARSVLLVAGAPLNNRLIIAVNGASYPIHRLRCQGWRSDDEQDLALLQRIAAAHGPEMARSSSWNTQGQAHSLLVAHVGDEPYLAAPDLLACGIEPVQKEF